MATCFPEMIFARVAKWRSVARGIAAVSVTCVGLSFAWGQRGDAQASAGDALVRQAVGAMVANDRPRLARIYEQTRDAEAAAGLRDGLLESDALLYLFNCTLARRDEFLLAQELAVNDVRDPGMRVRIVLSLLEDDYYAINQLKGQDRFNRFSRVFNRASSSLSKLAMFQPQEAAQLLLDAVYSRSQSRQVSDRERRIMHLSGRFLKNHPDAPEAEEVRQLREQLGAKLEADRAAQDMEAGKAAAGRSNWRGAEFFFENARVHTGMREAAAAAITEVRNLRQREQNWRETALGAGTAEKRYDAETLAAMGRAVRALLQGDSAALDDIAGAEPLLAPSLGFAQAALAERQGAHERALNVLAETARNHADRPEGQRAAALLLNPDYNLGEAFNEATAELKRDTRKYVLSGNRTRGESAYAAGSAAISATGGAAAGVPVLFATDMLVRGVTERFRTSMNTDQVVDAGARYLRRYPKSERSGEIAASVAELSRRAKQPDRSETYLLLTGNETPQELQRLKNDKARQLHESAMASQDLGRRKAILTTIVTQYADAKIAKTSQKELDKLAPTAESGCIALSRSVLEKDPAVLQGLGVDAALLDGSRSNGEMESDGVVLDAAGARVSYRVKGSPEFVVAEVPAAGRSQAVARAKALAYESGFRVAADDVVRKRLLPLAIKGGVGGGGVEVAPKIVPQEDKSRNADLYRR